MQYALVQFKDSKSVKYLVLTKDIKGYEPISAEDIPKREYMIKWEKSFHGEEGLVHDGYYAGNILLVGATPEEIRLKAKESKIRLPYSFPKLHKELPAAPAPKEPLKKQRRRRGEVDPVVEAKKKRMVDTVRILDGDKSKNKNNASKSRRDISVTYNQLVKMEDDKISAVNTDTQGNCGVISTQGNENSALNDNHGNGNCVESDKKVNSVESDMNGNSVAINPHPKKSSKSGSESGSDGDFSVTSGSGDDATVILDKLKKEHRQCERKKDILESEINKLRNDLKIYKTEMQSKRTLVKELRDEIQELKSLNLNLQRQLLKAGPKKSSQFPSSPLSFKATSPMQRTSPSSFFVVSPIPPKSPHVLKGTPSPRSVVKKLFSEVSSEDTLKSPPSKEKKKSSCPSPALSPTQGLKFDGRAKTMFPSSTSSTHGGENLEDVTRKIRDDLKGSKELEVNDEKAYVGMNTYINAKFWRKNIKKQRDDSKFLKDCAQAVWGIEELRVRTVERKSKDRPKIATPEKVDLLFAMLRGKLQARGLSKEEQDEVISKNGKLWLGQKMYDCNRASKDKKLP